MSLTARSDFAEGKEPASAPSNELGALLARAPLFAHLPDHERSALAAHFRKQHLSPGELLFRQGAEADGLYLIAAGRLVVSVRLPGDEELEVGTLGSGAVTGELAIVTRSTRAATVRAREPSQVWFLHRRAFEGLCAALSPTAFHVLERVALDLCVELRRMAGPAAASAGAAAPLGGSSPLSPRDVAFLRIFPWVRRLSASELAELLPRLERYDVPRGQRILGTSEPTGGLWIVLRGAVEVVVPPAPRLALVGPGRAFGVVSAIDRGAPSAEVWTRETSTLLRLSDEALASVLTARDALAFSLYEHLLDELGRALRASDLKLARAATFDF